jgi:hypothetical protein
MFTCLEPPWKTQHVFERKRPKLDKHEMWSIKPPTSQTAVFQPSHTSIQTLFAIFLNASPDGPLVGLR